MAFLLLLLLAAIALIITLVGYLLTPKPQTRSQRVAYQADYYVHPSRRAPVREPLAVRHARAVAYTTTDYVEESSTWLDMLQSMLVGRLGRRRVGEPTPWMGVTLVLLSVFLLGIFLMRTLMPNATLIGALSWPYTSTSSSSSNNTPDGPYTASKNLVRLSQLDAAQYNSPQE